MKKICIVTATRAEYGLLSSVIRKIEEDPECELQLIVTGTHLEPEYGNTYKEIEEDGIPINAKIQIIAGTDESQILITMANAIKRIGETIRILQPEVVILLGDRYEIHAVASACVSLKIPIAHISGGEISEGAYDEFYRHSITKLAFFHFASTEENRIRIIQMGEAPSRVFNVGDLGVENIKKVSRLSRHELEVDLGVTLGENIIQVTFHPVTLEGSSTDQFQQLLLALEKRPQLQVIFTRPNADTNSNKLNEMIDAYVNEHPSSASAFASLGYRRFLSLLSYCRVIIGNSSSGIVEAPTLRIGSINIGDRQKGRSCASTVLHCKPEMHAILDAIDTVLTPQYQLDLQTVISPYDSDETATKIVEILKREIPKMTSLKKTFYSSDTK